MAPRATDDSGFAIGFFSASQVHFRTHLQIEAHLPSHCWGALRDLLSDIGPVGVSPTAGVPVWHSM